MQHAVVAVLDGSRLDECVLQQASKLREPSAQLVVVQAAHQGKDASERACAAAQRADFLVLGLPAQHGLGAGALGSTVQHMLERSSTPVVIARDRRDTLCQLHEPARILVPLDGSAFAEAALPVAAELATRQASPLWFVQVVPLAGSLQPPGAAAWDVCPLDAMVSEAWTYLRNVAASFARAYGLETPRLHVALGQPWKAVGDLVRDDSIQLLVMATHAHAWLRRMLFGSVTDHVLRETAIPVVLVHPHASHVASADAIHRTPPASHGANLVDSGAR